MSEPFKTLAHYYDRLMSHVDYDAWVDRSLTWLGLPLCWKGTSPPPLILDLACGTGTATVLLAQRGYRVIGVDRSEDMLARARAKAEAAGVKPLLLQQSLETFTVDEPADAAICHFDSLNYLIEDGALQAALAQTAAALKPGTPFLFDLHTERRLREYGENTFASDEGDVAYIWESEYDERRKICAMYLTLFAVEEADGGWAEGDGIAEQHGVSERHGDAAHNGGAVAQGDAERLGGAVRHGGAERPVSPGSCAPLRYRRFDELHVERAYSRAEVRRALAQTGFRVEQIFGEEGDAPPSRRDGRIFYLVRRD